MDWSSDTIVTSIDLFDNSLPGALAPSNDSKSGSDDDGGGDDMLDSPSSAKKARLDLWFNDNSDVGIGDQKVPNGTAAADASCPIGVRKRRGGSASSKKSTLSKACRGGNLWGSIQNDYHFLMDDGIIETCKSTESDLSLDESSSNPTSLASSPATGTGGGIGGVGFKMLMKNGGATSRAGPTDLISGAAAHVDAVSPAAVGGSSSSFSGNMLSISGFIQQYDELNNWLAARLQSTFCINNSSDGDDCEGAGDFNTSLSEKYLNQLYFEELLQLSPRRRLLNEYAHELIVRYPTMKAEIETRLTNLDNQWKSLEQMQQLSSDGDRKPGTGGGSYSLSPSSSSRDGCDTSAAGGRARAHRFLRTNSVISDLTCDIDVLQQWLHEVELEIPTAIDSNLTQAQLIDLLHNHQHLQRKIESRSKAISAALKLCEKLLNAHEEQQTTKEAQVSPRDSTAADQQEEDSPSPRLAELTTVARNIEHRWHSVWLRSLEWQCRLEDAVQHGLRRRSVPSVALPPAKTDSQCGSDFLPTSTNEIGVNTSFSGTSTQVDSLLFGDISPRGEHDVNKDQYDINALLDHGEHPLDEFDGFHDEDFDITPDQTTSGFGKSSKSFSTEPDLNGTLSDSQLDRSGHGGKENPEVYNRLRMIKSDSRDIGYSSESHSNDEDLAAAGGLSALARRHSVGLNTNGRLCSSASVQTCESSFGPAATAAASQNYQAAGSTGENAASDRLDSTSVAAAAVSSNPLLSKVLSGSPITRSSTDSSPFSSGYRRIMNKSPPNTFYRMTAIDSEFSDTGGATSLSVSSPRPQPHHFHKITSKSPPSSSGLSIESPVFHPKPPNSTVPKTLPESYSKFAQAARNLVPFTHSSEGNNITTFSNVTTASRLSSFGVETARQSTREDDCDASNESTSDDEGGWRSNQRRLSANDVIATSTPMASIKRLLNSSRYLGDLKEMEETHFGRVPKSKSDSKIEDGAGYPFKTLESTSGSERRRMKHLKRSRSESERISTFVIEHLHHAAAASGGQEYIPSTRSTPERRPVAQRASPFPSQNHFSSGSTNAKLKVESQTREFGNLTSTSGRRVNKSGPNFRRSLHFSNDAAAAAELSAAAVVPDTNTYYNNNAVTSASTNVIGSGGSGAESGDHSGREATTVAAGVGYTTDAALSTGHTLDPAWDDYQAELYSSVSDDGDEEKMSDSHLEKQWDSLLVADHTLPLALLGPPDKGGVVVPPDSFYDGLEDDFEYHIPPVDLNDLVERNRSSRLKNDESASDDSDSDLDELNHVIEQSIKACQVTESLLNKKVRDPMDCGIYLDPKKYNEALATCVTNRECLEEVVRSVNADITLSRAERESVALIEDLIRKWVELEYSANIRCNQSSMLNRYYRDMVSLRATLKRIQEVVENNVSDFSDIQHLIDTVKYFQNSKIDLLSCTNLLAELTNKISMLENSETNRRLRLTKFHDSLRLLSHLSHQLATRLSAEQSSLEKLLRSWHEFNETTNELGYLLTIERKQLLALEQDATLEVKTTIEDVTATISDLKKLLNELVRYRTRLDELHQQLSTYFMRCSAFRQSQLRGSLTLASAELDSLNARCSALLQIWIRKLMVITDQSPYSSIYANSYSDVITCSDVNWLNGSQPTESDTYPSIPRRRGPRHPQHHPGDPTAAAFRDLVPSHHSRYGNGRTSESDTTTTSSSSSSGQTQPPSQNGASFVSRVLKTALPIQVALVVLLGWAAWMDRPATCCDSISQYAAAGGNAWQPQLSFLNGPPPV